MHIIYLCLVILTGKLAHMRGYPWFWWGIIGFFLTPPLAATILICLPNLTKKEPK